MSQRLSPRARAAITLTGVSGLAALVLGGTLDLSDYLQSIFVNAGTALLLLAPLAFAERLFSARVGTAETRATEARDEAREARREVADLDAVIKSRFSSEREQQQAVADDARTGEQAAMVDLFEQAATRRSIDRRGLRVLVGEFDVTVRARVLTRSEATEPIKLLELTFEDDALVSAGLVLWSPDEPAADVLVRLAETLRGTSAWPGEDNFSGQAILDALTTGLQRVIEVRRGPSTAVRPILELTDEWAITRDGLDALKADQWAEHDEFVQDSRHAWHRLENQTKILGWSRPDFLTAFSLAEKIHQALERENAASLDRKCPGSTS